MYRKILLAYDGSVAGRRALREGASLAHLCRAEVFLLAVIDVGAAGTAAFLGAVIDKDTYEQSLLEGVERLKALGFEPKSKLAWGDPGEQIVAVANEVGADLVVAGHRHKGLLAQWWSGSVGTYLVRNLKCSVLIGQSEISDEQFEKMMRNAEAPPAT